MIDKIKIFLLAYVFTFSQNTICQNIISNGDFENYSSCPWNVSQLNKADDWITASWSSPDYFNSCDLLPNPDITYDTVFAQSGTGFIGVFVENHEYQANKDYKEYATSLLTQGLIAGVEYKLSFWMRANLDGRIHTNATLPINERGYFGVCFSSSYPNTTDVTSATAPYVGSIIDSFGIGRVYIPSTDSVYESINWRHINLTYTATGGENRIIVGQFRPGSTVLTPTFTPAQGGYNYGCYFYIDNMFLEAKGNIATSLSAKKIEDSFKVYPNPSSGKIWLRTKQNFTNNKIEIRDVSNNLFYSDEKIVDKNGILLDINLSKGIYILKITDINTNISNFKKIVVQE